MARILIVDDEQEIVESLRMVLEEDGHDVDSASTARAGLEKIRGKEPPDLVIVDVMMETLTAGATMAREIRYGASAPHIPVILLSGVNWAFPGLGLSRSDLDNKAVPVDRFIEKPYSPSEVLRAVRELLEARREQTRDGPPTR